MGQNKSHEEPVGTILKNMEREAGWHAVSNILTDKLARIIGPRALQIYLTFKSLCRNGRERPFPNARQRDWATFMGMGLQAYQQNLKILEDVGLIGIRRSTGKDRWEHSPMTITLFDPDEVSITPDLLKRYRVKKLASECIFHDSLFDPVAWRKSMFKTKNEKVQSLEEEPVKQEERDIENHISRDIENHISRDIENHISSIEEHSKIEKQRILSKESKKGPVGPFPLSNDSFTPRDTTDNEWKIISQTTVKIKKENPLPSEGSLGIKNISLMTDRIKKKTSPISKDVSHTTKSDQLPSREEMPQTMQVWFDLPLVSKPKTLKVYKRNLSHLHKLSRGQFPTEYRNLKSDWTHKKNQPEITRKHLECCWTDEEIAHLLDTKFRQVLTDIAYQPQNKEKRFKGLSFESFLFNSHSGRSWFLELTYHGPQLETTINIKQTIERDPYPKCTYEIAEVLEISQKTNPEEYAGIARNFSKLVQFFQLLPVEEGHERDGALKFVNHPHTIANSLVGFFGEQYSWAISKGAHAGLLSLKGKPIRKWLEEWNDQPILLPGRKRPCFIWDLLDEYNQHGGIRMDLISTEATIPRIPEEEEEEAPPKPTAAELKQREEEAGKHLAPEDILREDGQKPEKGKMWPKIKAALARLKQGIPDPVVDESYAGF